MQDSRPGEVSVFSRGGEILRTDDCRAQPWPLQHKHLKDWRVTISKAPKTPQNHSWNNKISYSTFQNIRYLNSPLALQVSCELIGDENTSVLFVEFCALQHFQTDSTPWSLSLQHLEQITVQNRFLKLDKSLSIMINRLLQGTIIFVSLGLRIKINFT